MSRHIAPHRWADAFAGTLAAREVATMETHAESCARCARIRDRVSRASQSFPALRAQAAPELAWDSVRARVHWSVSSEKRTSARPPRRLVPAIAIGAVAAGATLFAVTRDSAAPSSRPSAEATPVAAPAPAVAPAATPLGAVVVREVGDQTMINGLVRRRIFDEVLGSGTVIATGDSRIDVQFEADSALQLGPSSSVRFVRFDSERIELALEEGTVDVVVGKRTDGQRFLITAGDRTVEVRGTRFRVDRGEHHLRVACAHGKVVVHDRTGEVAIAAEQAIEVAPTASLVGTRAAVLSAAQKSELTDATPHMLPVWTSPSQIVQTSSALEIATSGKREVRVDGLELGHGPLRVRVTPGRHTVESAERGGRFSRAGWVDVKLGSAARVDIQPDTAPASSGVAKRKRQLFGGIDRAALATCTRAIAKAGVTDTFVRFEIAIDETGALQFLNIIDTDLSSSTASCVRDVLASVPFKPGPAATFRAKLEL